jgi:pimeloyl-ACP methyl ester carboxylesterase
MQIGRRNLMAAAAAGASLTIFRGGRAADIPRARFVIGVSGPANGPAATGWAPLAAELQKRGFPTTFVPVISPRNSFTANETRASQIVDALKDVRDSVVIVGISNEGAVLPLVAAARPVRRLAYINAAIPRPGKAFIEVCNDEPVAVPGSLLDKLIKGAQPVTEEFLKLRADPDSTPEQWRTLRDDIQASPYASAMKNFYEVCPLTDMPAVDNVDLSGAADGQISPAWEQAAARRVLGVEPVVIPGAGHADIVSIYPSQVAEAIVRGL